VRRVASAATGIKGKRPKKLIFKEECSKHKDY